MGAISFATYSDVKTRYVDDRIWIFAVCLFAIASFIFVVVLGTSPQVIIHPLNIIGTTSGIGIAFSGWIMKFKGMGYATGDFFGLMVLSIILPSFNGIIIPVLAILLSCVLSIVITVAANLRINLKSRDFFSVFDEPAYKKILAYFIIHKKTVSENFVFPAERMISGKRKFQFRHEPDTQEFVTDVKEIYVCAAPPMMISILVGLTVVIIAAALI